MRAQSKEESRVFFFFFKCRFSGESYDHYASHSGGHSAPHTGGMACAGCEGAVMVRKRERESRERERERDSPIETIVL